MVRKKTIVAVSGGFDPLHVGHINLLQKACALGDSLTIILNNNNWLVNKKGFYFMDEQERCEILLALRYVDEVIISKHHLNDERYDVSQEIIDLKPTIFANGGDRSPQNTPEMTACQQVGCKMQFDVGGIKTQSSSWLTDKIKQETLKG